eukprot:179624-Chlamydomonas_euryale.AAC.1
MQPLAPIRGYNCTQVPRAAHSASLKPVATDLVRGPSSCKKAAAAGVLLSNLDDRRAAGHRLRHAMQACA